MVCLKTRQPRHGSKTRLVYTTLLYWRTQDTPLLEDTPLRDKAPRQGNRHVRHGTRYARCTWMTWTVPKTRVAVGTVYRGTRHPTRGRRGPCPRHGTAGPWVPVPKYAPLETQGACRRGVPHESGGGVERLSWPQYAPLCSTHRLLGGAYLEPLCRMMLNAPLCRMRLKRLSWRGTQAAFMARRVRARRAMEARTHITSPTRARAA
jgi:hypothetical protein